MKSREYPSTRPMMPITTPIFIISFCLTRPVEWAMAFGGVLIGKAMATDAATAMPMRTVGVPPMLSRDEPMPLHTTARIGTRSAAVAVFEMKLDSR